ncbi:MAG: hydantoinase B/oxoprolinase family protein [Cyclobacteriaceae bacterium]|nr:hydantoinase B/oxoprolinase family protein [Cyclobacteriaceae bacterium]
MDFWTIWLDTGGTFTDCIAHTPTNTVKRLKILSSGVLKGKVIREKNSQVLVQLHWPVSRDIFKGFSIIFFDTKRIKAHIEKVDLVKSIIYIKEPIKHSIEAGTTFEISSEEEVPVFAARLLTETSFNQSFPTIEMKLGSTRGTNALLERKGAATAMLITKGFKDLLRINTQQRNDLFALQIIKVLPLYKYVIEVDERIESGGTILKALSQSTINKAVNQLKKTDCSSVAIAFLNSYKNPIHEKLVEDQLAKHGFEFITASHKISQQIKILPRTETAVANAYLNPLIHSYVSNIQRGLAGASLKIMTSAGGLVDATHFHPKDSLLSGPAGGVVGAATAAKLSGIYNLITFDMGGTSTDVSLYDKKYAYRYESKVGEIKILSPSLSIETIAAGGGSICDFDGFRLTVGPHSAGASPGPACYGSGGPLTITDVNLLLGRTDAQLFSIPLYPKKSEEALQLLTRKIKVATGKEPRKETLLESLLLIANEKMAEAIKKVSVQQGHDPSDFTLLTFGGAGGQHACEIANLLGMKKILIPYDAGLLSAYGIGHAKTEHFEEKLLLQKLIVAEDQFGKHFEELYQMGLTKLVGDGFKTEFIKRSKQLVFLRFNGQESTIETNFKLPSTLRKEFKKKYQSLYGHWLADREIEVESIRLILTVEQSQKKNKKTSVISYSPKAEKETQLFFDNSWKKTKVYRWESLRPGATVKGPGLIVSENSTTLVAPNWRFNLDAHNHGILTSANQTPISKKENSKEAALELFSNRFTAVAHEMGALLQRTSFSVNVKERLDFSCAMMDSHGYLVVNAPHIPVHLGSMGICVREVAKVLPMRDGDVVITNHPAFGGSHLPDVTLIKPIFTNKKLIGYVAARAHHAEIGGKNPGSMPADATSLDEEGIIIVPTYLVKKGKPQWTEIRRILTTGKYPSRLPEENLADLNGASAAVNRGETELKSLCKKYGTAQVSFYMKALRKYASQLLRSKINSLATKTFNAEERLDDGALLKVKITIPKKGFLKIDFSGSSRVHSGNLNATPAIVQSVILYVLRLWVNKPIAMNEGLMEPVQINLPSGLLNPDFTKEKMPAVVGGNTEVSQRLTDTLLKALGLVACSQGTMNNFLFGNKRFGFYETICGGTGAGLGFDGTDAVHSHMTNTRITDPEILELRYPVRLERFEIRKKSGGIGRWKGGNGVEREITFKENAVVNILSQHRVEKPYGLAGGKSGKRGQQKLITSDNEIINLKGMDSVGVKAGDKILLQTPGGGGYGKLKKPHSSQ